jgi:hypothetical protein
MWTGSKKATPSEQRPAFINTAEAFCTHIEGAAGCGRTSFVRVCFVLISRLLSEVVELPEVEGKLDTHNVSDERYNEIAGLLKGKFEEDDYYTMMFDPYEIAAEPVVGSVSDDLSEIWRGVKNGLEALNHGNMEDAIMQWRFSFADHWGDQATQVLRPLGTLLLRDGWYQDEARSLA